MGRLCCFENYKSQHLGFYNCKLIIRYLLESLFLMHFSLAIKWYRTSAKCKNRQSIYYEEKLQSLLAGGTRLTVLTQDIQ